MFEKLSDPEKVRLVPGSIPIRHRYTPGIAGEAFFAALRDRGELLASRCEACDIAYCPARLFCERCFTELEPDTIVGPGGILESFTIGYRGVEGELLDKPAVVGLIRLDGADTVLVHFLLDGGGEPLEIGQRMEAVFEPKAKRSGSILDVRGFRPAGA